MMTDSVNHRLPPSPDSSHLLAANVTTIDRIEHTHTRLVSGASKLILSLPVFWPRAIAALPRYETIEVPIMSTRMTKIQVRKTALCSGITASAMNEISATPVTP